MERRARARKQGVKFHRREQKASVVANRIFIGNMDKRVTEYQVVQLCRPYGTIVQEQYCWTTAGPQKGTPAGYCFVEFSSRREAEAAVMGLNGKSVGGRALRVAFAREQESTAAAVQGDDNEGKNVGTDGGVEATNPSGGKGSDGSVESDSGNDGPAVKETPVGKEAKGGPATATATPKDIASTQAKMEAIRAKLRHMQKSKGVPQETAMPQQLPPHPHPKPGHKARQQSRYRPY